MSDEDFALFQATGAGAFRAGSPSIAARDGKTLNQVVVGVLGEQSHALTSVGADASEDGTGRGAPVIAFIHPRILRNSESSNQVGIKDGGVSDSLTTEGPGAVAFHLTQDPITGDVAPAMGTGSGGSGCATVGVMAFNSTAGTHSLDYGEVSPTLRVGSNIGIPTPPAVHSGLMVRRLTPVECQRLQGLPDDHLDLDPPLSDSAKYRLVGNGGVVECVRWILARLKRMTTAYLEREGQP